MSLCPKCRLQPHPVIRSAVAYCPRSAIILRRLKFYRAAHTAPALAKLLILAARDIVEDIDYIVAVPLHKKRILKRQYNQSALLALELAEHYRKPYLGNLLIKHRSTKAQTKLRHQDRIKNLRRAFHVRHPSIAQGKIILLVDDIITTTATFTECRKTLLKAGAKEVRMVSIARTLPVL